MTRKRDGIISRALIGRFGSPTIATALGETEGIRGYPESPVESPETIEG